MQFFFKWLIFLARLFIFPGINRCLGFPIAYLVSFPFSHRLQTLGHFSTSLSVCLNVESVLQNSSARVISDRSPIPPWLSDVRLLAPGNHILSSSGYSLFGVHAALGTCLKKDEWKVRVLRLHVFENIFIFSAYFTRSLVWNSGLEIMVFQKFDAIVSFSSCFSCYKRGFGSYYNSQFFVFDMFPCHLCLSMLKFCECVSLCVRSVCFSRHPPKKGRMH